ncbi:MAG: hypothetical protein ACETWO_04600 [Candidatus Hadarchaeaceae archaeon]
MVVIAISLVSGSIVTPVVVDTLDVDPDHPLYVLERAGESIKELFVGGIGWERDRAAERLDEYSRMVDKGKEVVYRELVEESIKHLRIAESAAETRVEIEMVLETANKSLLTLHELKERVTEETLPEIENAIDAGSTYKENLEEQHPGVTTPESEAAMTIVEEYLVALQNFDFDRLREITTGDLLNEMDFIEESLIRVENLIPDFKLNFEVLEMKVLSITDAEALVRVVMESRISSTNLVTGEQISQTGEAVSPFSLLKVDGAWKVSATWETWETEPSVELALPAPEEDLPDIPLYPGSTCFGWQRIEAENLIAVNFKSAASPEEITSFYKDEMPKHGWTFVEARYSVGENLIGEDYTVGGLTLLFEKADKGTTINIGSYANSSTIVIAYGPKEFTLSSITLPEDVPGEDFSDVPRCPKSARFSWEVNEEITRVSYMSTMGLEEIISFYKTEMPKHGWTFVSESSELLHSENILVGDVQTIELRFAKADETVQIYIPDQDTDLNSMTIFRRPTAMLEGIPISEDASGKDLPDVPRYPGSTRINYDELEEENIINVCYISTASFDEVVDFYKLELPKHGWVFESQVVPTGTFPENSSVESLNIIRLHFTKAEEAVLLDIDGTASAFTAITIIHGTKEKILILLMLPR